MSENDKQAEPVAQLYAHIYEFDSAVFGTHRSFSPSQWNGMKPTRTVAVYTHPAQPVQPSLSHVKETPKNEHDSNDVLKRAPLVRPTKAEINRLIAGHDFVKDGMLGFANVIINAMQEINK